MRAPHDPAALALAFHAVCTVARPGLPALRDLSFTLARGEALSLLGAGSATSLDVVAGFRRAESGQLRIAGRLMDATPPHRRGIGLVDRALSLFPHLDVRGHAGFAPGVGPAQADAMLQRLGLQSVARRRVQSLPAEMRLRVALARALTPAPRVLLLGDHILPDTLRATLRGLMAETGLCVLHATASVATTTGLSDRIGLLQNGRLRQLAAPQELYERPDTLEAAQAFGPVNLLAGTVLDSEDDTARIRLPGGIVVEARLAEPIADGQACVIALRPERIAVASVNATEMGEGALPAKLISTQQEGALLRLRFAVEGGAGPGTEIVVTRPSNVPVPRGQSICLAWQPHHAHAFPPEAA